MIAAVPFIEWLQQFHSLNDGSSEIISIWMMEAVQLMDN